MKSNGQHRHRAQAPSPPHPAPAVHHADADPNANDFVSLETENRGDGGGSITTTAEILWQKDGSPVPPLVSQRDTQRERIILWDADTDQCEELVDLQQLQLLEREELEAFLVTGGRRESEVCRDDNVIHREGGGGGGGGGGGRKQMKGVRVLDRHPRTTSTSTNATTSSFGNRGYGYRPADTRDDNRDYGLSDASSYQQNNNNHWRAAGSMEELEAGLEDPDQQAYTSESLRKARSSSEGNVFASASLSAVPTLSSSLASALDASGCVTTTAQSTAGHYAAYPTSAQSLRARQQQYQHPLEMDQNHNSMLPQGRATQAYALPQGNANRKHLPSRLVPPKQRLEELQQCMKADWRQEAGVRQSNGSSSADRKNERVPPCRRQLVRPFLSEAKPEHPTWAPDPAPSHPHQQHQHQHQHQQQQQHQHHVPHPGYSSTDLCYANSRNQHLIHRVSGYQMNGSSQGSGSLKGGRLGPPSGPPSGPSSLERRTPVTPRLCRSPSGSQSPPSPRDAGSPRRHPQMVSVSPPKPHVQRGYPGHHPHPGTNSLLRAPVRTGVGTGIPKAPMPDHRPAPVTQDRSSPPKCPPKPKTVRPKIITYVRKGNSPAKPPEGPHTLPHPQPHAHQVSSLPSRLGSSCGATQAPAETQSRQSPPALSASNLLFDKYRHEVQRVHQFLPSGGGGGGPGAAAAATGGCGVRAPPTYTIPHKQSSRTQDNYYGSLNSKYTAGGGCRGTSHFGGTAPGHPSGPDGAPQRVLRPQLGVAGAVRGPTGTTSTKNRTLLTTGQNQPVQAVVPAPQNTAGSQADTKKASAVLVNPKSLLPKPASLSGLRPPGYSSRLPPSRLTAFGFVRSSSVSSVSSTHSGESARSDPCKPALRPSSVNDEPPFHRIISTPQGGSTRQPSLQPPATPALKRRSLLPPPAAASKKEVQKTPELIRSAVSSPKRLAVVSPKPQSPVVPSSRPRPVAAITRVTQSTSPQKEPLPLEEDGEPATPPKKDPPLAQQEEELRRLQQRCEEQQQQLESTRAELKKTTLGLEAFAVCTQHLCLQTQSASEREKELSFELEKIQDEVVCNREQLELIQREKAELELSFQQEVRELQGKQEAELSALEEGLRSRHSAELEHLRAEHQSEMEELRTQQQEQVDEMVVSHASAMGELKAMQSFTMATVQEEHTRTMRDLRKAHEQQKSKLEEDFQQFQLSMQDQVDTLTFQNQALRDKAKRFEEALRRSADEQILDALAPYQHIEEDLKSLKDVLEMKNQQIHDQEKKILDLEKVAHKNVVLEERVQVLQQQNEDLKARIDQNLAISRHLSEENASLQVSVEKESTEKKRLSRNNEELLWRLQMSPCASPSHRASSSSTSPTSSTFFPASSEIPPYVYSPGPGSPVHFCYPAGGGTPTHHGGTPTHRASVPLSGPGSPAHGYPVGSSGPHGTPTHRGLQQQQQLVSEPGSPAAAHRHSSSSSPSARVLAPCVNSQ